MGIQLPVWTFYPELAFPETAGVRTECKIQSTAESERKIAGVVLAICNLMKTGKPSNDMTLPQFYAELNTASEILDVPLSRMMDWAESVCLSPTETLSREERKAVPTRNIAKNFDLHEYQIDVAAWCARRLGSVEALGCGVGKTATAIAAAIAAKRLGIIKGDRVYIICPLNAVATWRKAAPDLRAEFKDVQIVSIDSLHLYRGLSVADGGAVIIDEAHKAKHETTGRTKEAHELRRCFEWGCCLTGSLLHTGPEGLLSILDVACPGSSRFLDKWAFGDAFNCVAGKLVQMGNRKRKKHSLVIPGEEIQPILARYLERAVRSLSITSPEVAAVVQVPGQTKTTVDTWEKPEWVTKLEIDCREKLEAAARAPQNAPPLGIAEVVWAPDVSWQTLMGSLAVCIMGETRDEILEVANEIENTSITSVENAVKSIQARLDDPTYRENDQEWMSRRKPLIALIKNPGLPTFGKVLHAACRLGRYDHTIVKHTAIVNELKTTSWIFQYGPGHSRKNPGLGPKSQFVIDWLADNGKEPLVAGAAGKGTIAVIAQALTDLKVSHRIIRGGVSSKNREKFVDEFNRGDVQVMLLQQVAGSESVDLVRAATSLLVDHDWSASTYTQYLARTCRQGQKRECIHYDLSFTGVQNESIARLIRGQDFDANTRAALEREYNMNMLLSGAL
jgi:hypothetical protein